MNIILCGGGTAGHINPAIAIAEEIKHRYPDSKILFIGREEGFENNLIKKSGFEYKTIKIQGLKRSICLTNLKIIHNALKAKQDARKIIESFNPDIVLGTGGYVCWPVISAAKKMNIPVAIHESNCIPGLTTRLLAGKCDIVFLSNKETENYISKAKKTVICGTPILKSFLGITREQARKSLGIRDNEIFILSFGGSIGSEKMNETIIDLIQKYSSKNKSVRHIHATGKNNYETVIRNTKIDEGCGCHIVPYIDNMPTVLHASDIVICRCGAITLSELASVGVAAILIPSPNVAENHQFKNAKMLADDDAAILIEEKDLTYEAIKKAVEKLKNDKNGRKTKAKRIKDHFTQNSTKIIADELFNLKNESKKAVF